MNQQSDRYLKKFAAIFSAFLLATAASFGATTALTVQIMPGGSGAVSPNYNERQLVIGKTYSMTAVAKNGFTFTNWTGSLPTNKAKLTFVMASNLTFTANFFDKQKPTLTMTPPPGSRALTSETVIVTGRAKDNAAVTNVLYSLNGGTWTSASTGDGWSNWWVSVTLNANTNTLQAYAVDSSGNQSKIAKVNMTFIAVPASLDGFTATVTNNADNDTYTMSFTNKTFSQNDPDNNANNGVGTYTFVKRGPATGRLSIIYTAPPPPTISESVYLQFSSTNSGGFTNDDGTTSTFGLSQQTNLTPSQLAGTTISIGGGTNLTFPSGYQIIDNGHMFNVSNPLVISLSTPYADEIGDRVSVAFTQLKNFSGQFIQTGTPVFYGTVIDFDTNADTVTILFDKSTFVSKTELFAPVTGDSVNILTYYYTNFLEGGIMTNGTGTFVFTNYSPVGALLQLNQSGENEFFILTFTDNSGSGNYFEQSGTNQDSASSGSFGLTLPPEITVQPLSITNVIGSTVSFSVTASGTQPFNYQWVMDGLTVLADGTNPWGSVISGSTSNVLTLTGVATNDAGIYQVIVSNNVGGVFSSGASLTITNF